MSKRTSVAAKELSAELERRGHDIPPRRLEDWASKGLLQSSPQHGLGYPGGSVSWTPGRAADRAIAAEALLARHRIFPRAVLAMFAEGHYEVPLDKLERAYVGLLDRAEATFEKLPGDTAQPALHAAARLATRAAKRADLGTVRERLRRVAGARRMYASERMRRYFHEVSLVMLTGETSPGEEGFDQLISGFGIADAVRETSATGLTLGGRPPRLALKAALSQSSIDGLKSTIKGAGPAQLIQARREAASLVAFSRAFSSVTARVHSTQHAFGFAAIGQMDSYGVGLVTLALLVVRKVSPGKLDSFLRTIDSQRPRYQARDHLLDHLDPKFHTVFQGEEAVHALSKRDLNAFQGQLAEYQSRYPRSFELASSAK